MSLAIPAAESAALRRADERRLSVAMAASLVIHALALAALRGWVPAIDALPASASFATLQAVIATPAAPPPSERPMIDEIAMPELVVKPAVLPLEPRAPPLPLPTPEPLASLSPAASEPSRSGTPRQVSITVGTIDDPGKLGGAYAALLMARFPAPVEKLPRLAGTPPIAYPAPALEAGVERRVVAVLTLRADGSIERSELAREDPMFGPAVLDALTQTRFAPAEVAGKGVPYWAIVEFVFLLSRPPPASSSLHAAARRFPIPPQPSVGK
ncbi:MAG TPA: energy transducer TonB [Casimicrobiaceae bacterium]|nr:energy transducer TonB [Casimicrobiaceae bacterium]